MILFIFEKNINKMVIILDKFNKIYVGTKELNFIYFYKIGVEDNLNFDK